MSKDTQIKAMINRTVKGKMPIGSTRQDWQRFNTSFRPMTLTARQLAIEVWRGHAFTPVFNRRRRKENFIEAWHIAFDFDAGDQTSSIDHLTAISFVDWFASFGYSTPSSTPETPKTRIVFVFDKPCKNVTAYEHLYLAMMERFAEYGCQHDAACKDALRLYYGSPNCNVWANWSILPATAAQEWLEEYQQNQPEPEPQKPIIAIPRQNISEKFLATVSTRLLDNIRNAADGEKYYTLRNISRTFGGYVASGYYDRASVAQQLFAAISAQPIRDKDHAMRTIEQGLAYGANEPLYFERNVTLDIV